MYKLTPRTRRCIAEPRRDGLQESQNNHIKTIANTRWVLRNGYDPHTFVYADGYFTVDEDGEMVPAARTATVKDRRVSLYHYVTRSLEDFSAKV